jgi:hypothetical protein
MWWYFFSEALFKRARPLKVCTSRPFTCQITHSHSRLSFRRSRSCWPRSGRIDPCSSDVRGRDLQCKHSRIPGCSATAFHHPWCRCNGRSALEVLMLTSPRSSSAVSSRECTSSGSLTRGPIDWLAYGTSHIGGTRCAPDVPYTGPLLNGSPTFDPYNDVPAGGCTGQTQASWRIPVGFQMLPALVCAHFLRHTTSLLT